MGSDNLFHKRKAKPITLNRSKFKREAYDMVLIVCEGQTETFYFQEAVDHYRIHSANVKISNDGGSDPINIVNYAVEQYKNEKHADSGGFDRVYCVFDEDGRKSYQRAITKLKKLKPKEVFYAVTSVPCFEYWLLLHFTYTTASLVGTPAIEKQLKKYWPTYKKASQNIFLERFNQLESAIINAERVLSNARTINNSNPSTNVHELISYLKNLKSN